MLLFIILIFSSIYLIFKVSTIPKSQKRMFNPNSSVPFNLFCPLFGLESYFWLKSPQKPNQKARNNGQITHIPVIKGEPNVKIEQDHEICTQKAEISSNEVPEKGNRSNSDVSQQIHYCKEEIKIENQQLEEKIVQRNQTKNISKNFGKAILSFAKNNTKFSRKLLKYFNVDKQALINYIKKARKNLNSLQDLRDMWGADNENDKLKKCLRIISHHFMRKHCLAYIFNSRIKSVGAHTKYRHRLMEGMTKPSQFTNIKLN